MKKLIISLLLISLCGCASFGINHMHGTINGPISYQGATVMGNVEIDHWGCIGSCSAVNMSEIINDTRPSDNTSK